MLYRLALAWRFILAIAWVAVLAIFLVVFLIPSFYHSMDIGRWEWVERIYTFELNYLGEIIDIIWDSLVITGLMVLAAFLQHRLNSTDGFLLGLAASTVIFLFNYNFMDSLLYGESVIGGLAFWDYGMPMIITGILTSLTINVIGYSDSRWLFGRPRSANPKPNEIW